MVLSWADDCQEALECDIASLDSRSSRDPNFPSGQRCMPWLIRSLLSASIPEVPVEQSRVQVLWHSWDDANSSCHPIGEVPSRTEVSGSVFVNGHLGSDDPQFHLEFWNPLNKQRLANVPVSLSGDKHWSVPVAMGDRAHNHATGLSRFNHATIELVEVERPDRLADQWRALVQESDATFLIAPQPDMERWMAAVSSLSSKVFGWPIDTLRLAEDKRHFTTVPSLDVQPAAPEWQFKVNGCSSGTAAGGSVADAGWWYQTHLASTIDWVLKPHDQCGGCDVWKITLAKPITDWELAKRVVQELRRYLPCETKSSQALLWSPWISGHPGSLSVLATPAGWWCFPPCRQCLKFSEIAIPPALKDVVAQVQSVQYLGSEIDSELAPDTMQELLWQQFASRLTHQQQSTILGWFGIDFVAKSPNEIALIEVNPRVTSSYNLLRNLRWAAG